MSSHSAIAGLQPDIPSDKSVYGYAVTSRAQYNSLSVPKTRPSLGVGFMLITKKLPQGFIYPQLTQAPIKTYADFLNCFRGGHTIDDNLGAGAIQATMQYKMFETAIASGHLTKSKNMAIPDEFLADIFLTEAGADLAQPALDREFCVVAVAEARKSLPEDDGEPHPYVGAVS